MTIQAIILQVANLPSQASQPTEQSLSLLDLLMKGGYLMIPILLLSLISFYVLIERWLAISRAGRFDDQFFMRVREQVFNGNLESAKSICQGASHPAARVLSKGVARVGKPVRDIETAMETAGKLELSTLEKNTAILGIIAGIAPMFGFIGTISGVIKIFYNISLADNISIGLISGGLYEKMITSAAGLVVGVIAFVGYHVLNIKIDKLSLRLESLCMQFLDAINEPK
jgi:biopolymer transport protein ExbB